MKFIRIRPSGEDKDIPVFEFAFGKEELKLLLDIAHSVRDRLPEMLELSQMKNRLNNIIKEFEKVLRKYGEKSKPEAKK